ncbi:MAG: hypothetical protein WBD58_22615, partial [Geitlerinemataceae cyanobacterium]
RLNLTDRFGFVTNAIDRIPKPIRNVALRPVLLLVLASHYGLLMMPSRSNTEASETPPEPEEVQEEIKIARIQTNKPTTAPKTPTSTPAPTSTPTSATPAATATQPSPTTPAPAPAAPAPAKAPTPAPAAPPPVAAPAPAPAPAAPPPVAAPAPAPAPAAPPPVAAPAPAPAPAAPPPAPAPPAPTPTPEPTPEPAPEKTPLKPTPEPTPEKPPADPNANPTSVQDPFVDFPFPPGFAVGSLGLLQGASDGEARNVAQGLDDVYGFYAQQLPPKSITIDQPVKNESNFRIFPLKTPEKTQYLHLVTQEDKTVILLASQPIEDLAALANAGTISVEEERFYVAAQAAGNDLALLQFNRAQLAEGSTQFVDPNRYRPEGVTSEQRTVPIGEVQAQVKARLSEQGFAAADTSYQGVPAIQATLGTFTGYIIFAPAYITPGSGATERTAVLTSTTAP